MQDANFFPTRELLLGYKYYDIGYGPPFPQENCFWGAPIATQAMTLLSHRKTASWGAPIVTQAMTLLSHQKTASWGAPIVT